MTDTPLEWDEHAHFPTGSSKILFGSSRDLVLDPADLWVIDESGARRRLTFFNDPAWSLRPAQISAGLFTADGAFSPDGLSFANFLLLDPVAQNGAIVVLTFSRPL